MTKPLYTEDLDETFGDKPRANESDADVIRFVEEPHPHDWATEYLAVGGMVWTKAHVQSLVNSRVTHVINCCAIGSDELYKGTKIDVLLCATDDNGLPKEDDWFFRGINFATRALVDSRRPARILVHCAAGQNRSAAMAYAILRASGMGEREAWDAIKSARKVAAPKYVQDAERAARKWLKIP